MEGTIAAFCLYLLVACPAAPQGVVAEGRPHGAALQRLDELLARPRNELRLYSDDSGAASSFQFELRILAPEKQGRLPYLRVIVEQDRGKVAMLLLTEGGIPYAHIGDQGLIFLDRAEPGNLVRLPGVFILRLRELGDLLQLFDFTNTPRSSTVQLDVGNLIKEIRNWDDTPAANERTSTLTFRGPKGSSATIRFNREKGPCRFPIARFSARDKGGKGITLVSFHLDGTAPRRVCQFRVRDPARVRTADAWERGGGEAVFGLIGWLFDVKQVARIDREKPLRAAGLQFLENIPANRELPTANRERMEALLASLSGKSPTALEREEWLSTFAEFSQLLGKECFHRALVTYQGKDSTHSSYIMGYDRRRSADLLEVQAGPELAARVYELLREVILHPPHKDSSEQIAALELLGQLGVPEGSGLLEELEGPLKDNNDEWVRTFWASLRACTGSPTDEDVARLRAAVEDKTARAKYRYVCLQSLLLLDETRGLEPILYDLLAHPAAGDSYLMRCLLTTGCSREGLDVLMRLATERPQIPSILVYMCLLQPVVHPSDRPWPAFMKLVKEVSLDDDEQSVTRVLAGELAAADRADRDFRERFVRTALRLAAADRAEAFLFLRRAQKHYLEVDHDAHRYVAEFLGLLGSAESYKRKEAAEVFTTTCPIPVPSESESVVTSLLETIFADLDVRVRAAGIRFLWRYKDSTGKVPLRLLALLVEAARREQDARDSVAMLIHLSGLSAGSFRMDHPKDAAGKPRLDAETFQWMRENRRRLESEAQKWLEDERKKSAPKPRSP